MAGLKSGTAAVVDLVRSPSGAIRSARVRLFESTSEAEAALSRPR